MVRQLSERDRKVIELLSEGCTQVEIANALHYSASSVANLVEGIRERFGARNSTHLVAMYLRGEMR